MCEDVKDSGAGYGYGCGIHGHGGVAWTRLQNLGGRGGERIRWGGMRPVNNSPRSFASSSFAFSAVLVCSRTALWLYDRSLLSDPAGRR